MKSPKNWTIGFLVEDLNDSNAVEIWHGMADSARQHDCTLITEVYKAPFDLQNREGWSAHAFNLIHPDTLDGLVVWTGALNSYLSQQEIDTFFASLRPMPLVSIAMEIGNVPSVLLDNYSGMYAATQHLIEVHKRRRIVFVSGPEGHQESSIRLEAYHAALTEAGIAYDPALVIPGGFSSEDGVLAAQWLYQHHLVFDAILTNDDQVASSMIESLPQICGLRVPQDVLVLGFDDFEGASSLNIPLTTVHIPNYELGKRAGEMLLDLLSGNPVPMTVVEPLTLMVRQSCGCPSLAVENARTGQGKAVEAKDLQSLPAHLAEIAQAARSISVDEKWQTQEMDELSRAFLASFLQGSSGTAFFEVLNKILLQRISREENVLQLENLISALRKQSQPYLRTDREVQDYAEDLWQQARVIIAETAQRIETRRRLDSKQVVLTLQEISQSLITSFEHSQLLERMLIGLPEIGISGCFLALYEDGQPLQSQARILLAYLDNLQLQMEELSLAFPSHQLVPGNWLFNNGPSSWVLHHLTFQEEYIGFVLFKAGPQEGWIYEVLRTMLSSALKGTALHNQVVQLSLTDSLCEVGNRRAYELNLTREIEHTNRQKVRLSLIMIDIDHFKEYNDTYGHPAGDEALWGLACCIKNCSHRRTDFVARIGGDEFAVILPDTDIIGAQHVAEEIRSRVINDPVLGGRLSISLGVATLSEQNVSPDEFIHQVDEALYHAKNSGRNRVELFS
jgi:diguanylate cyclase (GGDEF)-like protein